MPSTDLTSQKWNLRGSLNLNKFTKGGMIQVPGLYQNPLLRVEIRLRGLKTNWNQLGYLHQTHAGATHPKGHYLSVHDQILQLANLAPYKIFIQLVPWTIRESQSGRLTGSLRFYESGTKLTNVDLSNLDSFHRQQMSLVNPISINIPPEMDNSTKFTRSIAVDLVESVSSVLATVNDTRTGMVLRNSGAFNVYLCLAETATTASAIVILEPNGFYELCPADYNGVVSVICPDGDSSIAGSEMAASEFIVTQPTGMTAYGVPFNPGIVARYNPVLNNGTVQRSYDNGLTWEIVNDGANIESAKLAQDGQLHIKTRDDMYFYSPIVNGSWQASNMGNYDGLNSASGTIQLITILGVVAA